MTEQPIETRFIPQSAMVYQSIIIAVVGLFIAILLQITYLSRTAKIETSLNNMRNACVLVAEKGMP